MQARTNTLPTALGLMLLAFLCFSSMDTIAKWLATASIPALQVAFVRFLVHFLWVVALFVPTRGFQLTRSSNIRLQLLRAMMLLGSTVFNFTALHYLPLSTTIAIFFAAPIGVCLLSIPLLGEKVGMHRMAAVLVGFAGVLVIVQPWSAEFNIHMLYSLAALACVCLYFVLSRKLAGGDDNAVTQFYAAGLPTLALLPLMFISWSPPANTLHWGLMFALGSLAMLGHSLLVSAHQRAEASVLAPTVYSQILYISIFSWVIFGSTPDQQTVIGTLIIVASGVYIWWREKQLAAAINSSDKRGYNLS